MGIVSSTFASLAIQLAWNCQRLLDPQYRCVEGGRDQSDHSNVGAVSKNNVAIKNSMNCMEFGKRNEAMNEKLDNPRASGSISCSSSESSESESSLQNFRKLNTETMSRVKRSQIAGASVVRQRYRKRPASFDTALIIHRSDNQPSSQYVSCVITSTPSTKPSPLAKPQTHFWDVTSSSGCSSDSGSYLDSDSEVENDRLNEAFIKKCEDCSSMELDENEKITGMSADEEAAFRMTVGRGHFSRSKKDRFLNHLRLEKRLNGINNCTFYGYTNKIHGHGRNKFSRRYSGDLYRVTY